MKGIKIIGTGRGVPSKLVTNEDMAKIVDANDDGAWAEMSTDHISYAEIIERMEADHSIPDDQKTEMIRTVLNGRWFSGEMDAYYGNEDLWA